MLLIGGFGLALFYYGADSYEGNSDDKKNDDDFREEAAVFVYEIHATSFDGEESQQAKYAVPYSCAYEGEEGECTEIHARESCGDRDKLSDDRYKATHEGAYHAMFVEIFLGSFHFFARKAKSVPQFAVDELIYNRSSEPQREEIVDIGTY